MTFPPWTVVQLVCRADHSEMELAAEPPTRAAQCLAMPPPLAPAAQRCDRTFVTSIMCTSQ
jgi:hypothetical protein